MSKNLQPGEWSLQFRWECNAYKGKRRKQGPLWETPLPEALGETPNQLPGNKCCPLLLSATGKTHKCHNSSHHYCLFLLAEWKKQREEAFHALWVAGCLLVLSSRDCRLSAFASGWSVPMANLVSWNLEANSSFYSFLKIKEQLKLAGASGDHVVRPPGSKKIQLKQVDLYHISSGFEYLQGWRPHSLPGQTVPVLDYPSGEVFCLKINLKTLWQKGLYNQPL